MLGVHSAIAAGHEWALLAADDEAWMRHRFEALEDEKDWAYTWSNFVDVQAFYGRAAEAGRAVVFTAT